ncbi:mannosyltransferase, partial [Physocladia obscura]
MSKNYAFASLVLARVAAALAYRVITDCDEVFNYWEPVHFLHRTSAAAFQTWEYSPQFNIRSWFYAGIHALLARTIVDKTKSSHLYPALYILQYPCNICCRVCVHGIALVSRNSKILRSIRCKLVTSLPPIFHWHGICLDSTPSFYILNVFGNSGHRSLIENTAIEFANVLVRAVAIPFLVKDLISENHSWVDRKFSTRGSRFFSAVKGGISALIVLLVPTIVVDRVFYGFWSVVPLNIVFYNVFSGSGDGKGPGIFAEVETIGTEPCMQPHKEERFIFVIYPLIAFAAAISTHLAIKILGILLHGTLTISKNKSSRAKPRPLWQSVIVYSVTVMIAAVFIVLSLSRTVAMVQNYGAPFKIYTTVSSMGPATTNTSEPAVTFKKQRLCIGKEWYRFPSHFFIPDEFLEVRFIKSEFAGLLPAKFGDSFSHHHGTSVPKIWQTTRQIPSNLNEYNIEDTTRYVQLSSCDYLVDSDFGEGGRLEPRFVADEETWEHVQCERFLDAGKSSAILGRVFWIPDKFYDKRVWG